MDGIVVHGLQRGRPLGFPTANLDTENELLPPNGVYATLATLDGVEYPSVTNIGVRPTFHLPSATVVETHVLDIDRDLYGKPMRVAFVHRIREERTFDGVEALKAQITADCQSARTLLAHRHVAQASRSRLAIAFPPAPSLHTDPGVCPPSIGFP